MRLSRRAAPWLFVAPFALSFLCFTLWPLLKSLVLAFSTTHGPKAQVFTGTLNFRYLLGDPEFWLALRNTLVFTAGSLLIQLPAALGLALLLNQGFIRARALWRFAFFSPYLAGHVFTAILFGIVFGVKNGLVNRGLSVLTGTSWEVPWLTKAPLVMPSLILTALWMYAGFNMVYFLAALQAVEKDLYDAARVDGANAWQRFRHVTLPGIRPVLVFVAVLSTIGSLQLFELPYLIFKGTAGPERSGLTIVIYLFEKGFGAGDLGFASAVGWILALIMLVISLAQLRLTRWGAER